MVKKKSNWNTYDYMLRQSRTSNRKNTINTAQSSFKNLIMDNPAYQENATRNGEIQPMLVTRTSTTECSVQTNPGDLLFIGDLVECYNEKWLVTELFQDEYGLISGKMWLCNYLCNFQNNTPDIVKYYSVIDDGSYSKSEKNITTTDSQYTLYISLDDKTEKLYIDKRLAIGTMYDKNQKKILQVMKIVWIDKQETNFGSGSHLLKIRLSADVYNAEKDNIDELICDYIKEDVTTEIVETNETTEEITEETQEKEAINYSLTITGKDVLKIGTSRTYKIEGEVPDNINIIWSVNNSKYTLIPDGLQCKVSVPLDGNLIGDKIQLLANDADLGVSVSKEIEVITIG